MNVVQNPFPSPHALETIRYACKAGVQNKPRAPKTRAEEPRPAQYSLYEQQRIIFGINAGEATAIVKNALVALIPAAAGIDEPSFASCVLALDVTTTFCQYHDSQTILLMSGLKSCKLIMMKRLTQSFHMREKVAKRMTNPLYRIRIRMQTYSPTTTYNVKNNFLHATQVL